VTNLVEYTGSVDFDMEEDVDTDTDF